MPAMILRKLRALVLIGVASLAILFSSCQMCQMTKNCADGEDCHPHARICHNPTMHALASDLDYLEEHIDKYGSVVAMQPAVWGQARLTKYRQEFEDEMFKDHSKFLPSLQGSLSRSDQAYLASATAISAAISGPKSDPAAPSIATVQTNTANADVFKAFDPSTPGGLTRTPALAKTDKDHFGFAGNISLEPTILLDQKARYLNHLNQIRRNNEGDDTADSPGYSLNLVRVPVSVLPGKCTMKGYGAEITMTLKPYISEELLPATFRQLVVNDIVDMLALPMAKLADLIWEEGLKTHAHATMMKKHRNYADVHKTFLAKSKKPDPGAPEKDIATFEIQKERVNALMKGASRQRVAAHPLPPSQIVSILGIESLTRIGVQVHSVISSHENSRQHVYILDARATLRDEVEAAYELLAQPKNMDLWTTFCTFELAQAIRTRDDNVLVSIREKFLTRAKSRLVDPNVTADLAWAIIVESALLNEKLKQDIRQAAANTGKPLPNADHVQFFLPGPMLAPEARYAFNEYVRVRWPIHVFAVDPVSQDQNIADTYSKRQEMQLALTLAFASGNINASNMTRYARRIEKDMETIAINKTQIGFSHGEDTFGWRFYPRYQTPEIEGNFKTIFRDQLIGGPSKNAEIRQTRLEPGMRECVAIVLMPAFVPYVTCETSSNWFKLTNPKCKEFTLTDAIHLGKLVKGVQTCSPNIKNAQCYRDGDLARLLTKAKQLEARLPLQNTMVQVPYENTLGGFEMFNTGITDLAPELIGWYGGPGIRQDAETQLFLVGDHFSVHHTRVIAGGKDVGHELISRQIMRVTIPAGTTSSKNKYVDVHVATPYGVTAHLEIPLIEGAPGRNEFTWVPTPRLTADVKIQTAKDLTTSVTDFNFNPAIQKVEIVDNVAHPKEFGLDAAAKLNLTVTVYVDDVARNLEEIKGITISFKSGRAEVDLASLNDKFKAIVKNPKSWSAKDKANAVIRLDVTGVVGIPSVEAGITFTVLPSFSIFPSPEFVVVTAIPAPGQPNNIGTAFGTPTPAAVHNDARAAQRDIATRPTP